jgi:integral membrane protein (TIGR01906 family)
MEMKDVLYVTEEMMKYLIDHRGDLVVNTTVDGVQREFFNDREKIHMQDVKNLFMGGIRIGWVAFFVMCCSILILKFNKADLLRVLPRAFLTSIGIVGSILAVFAYFVSRNFSAMFIQFHLLFFHNDYWILNPETDLMINILPENFFFDVVKAIGTVYGIALAVLFLVSVFIVLFQRRQNRAHK